MKLLLKHADDEEVRVLMAPEIAQAFVESSLPTLVENLDELAEFVPHRNGDEMASYDQEFSERLTMACTSKAVFVAFVEAKVARPGPWLGYLLPVNGKHRTTSINAIAYIRERNVQIYRLRALSQRLLVVSEVHVYVHNPKWPLLKMLHTNMGQMGAHDMGTHFDRLNPVDDSMTYKMGQSWAEEVRESIGLLDKPPSHQKLYGFCRVQQTSNNRYSYSLF